ncbi:MAG: hypothetical protein QM621_02560 [Aeromicrobium sp.]|uniref:hypothetical protein n=1 Tax=Aeromicrobium sp. TaxID=1871063 RepID=UPI0039E29C79
MYAETGAGLLITPGALQWWLHLEGWTAGLRVSDETEVVVAPGHGWAGQPSVTVLDTQADVAQATVTALVAAVGDLVAVIRERSGAGVAGLWHEVSDALAASIGERPHPATVDEVERLRELISVPRRPWKRLARIDLVESGCGPAVVCHRGGCCQAFTAEASTGTEIDAYEQALAEAFPASEGEPEYCGTCKFRTFDDVVARTLWARAYEAH